MAFDGPQINQSDGNTGSSPEIKDRVIALVIGGVATADLALDTPKVFVHPSQAAALGIDAAYDANNGILVYDQLVEAFRLLGDKSGEVVFMLTARPDGTYGNELKDWFNDDGPVETLLRNDLGKDVKYVFTCFNAAGTYSPTFTNGGLADEVRDSIAPAQALRTRLFEEKRYLHGIMLDGWDMQNVADVEDLRDEAAPNVSVLIAVDGYVLDNYPAYPSLAAVGAAMGMYMVRNINENLGSVELTKPPGAFAGKESFPLGNGIRWEYAALLNGDNINQHVMAVQKALAAKAVIFAGAFADYAGFFFSGDPTCVELASDYAWINRNCVFSEAARLARLGTIPKVRAVMKRNPATGNITGTSAKVIEKAGQKKLNQLLERDLVSDVKFFVSDAQKPSQTVPLKGTVKVIYDEILYALEIDLGLYNTL
jgi:hypothetical protein